MIINFILSKLNFSTPLLQFIYLILLFVIAITTCFQGTYIETLYLSIPISLFGIYLGLKLYNKEKQVRFKVILILLLFALLAASFSFFN